MNQLHSSCGLVGLFFFLQTAGLKREHVCRCAEPGAACLSERQWVRMVNQVHSLRNPGAHSSSDL